MGQAKHRGTYEQRSAEAAGRAKAKQAEQDRLDDLRYAERCKTRPPQNIGVIGGGRMRHSQLAAAELLLHDLANEKILHGSNPTLITQVAKLDAGKESVI